MENCRELYEGSTLIIIQDAINRAIEKTPATEDVKNKIIAESIDILNRDIVAYEKDRKTVDFLADSLLQYLKNRVSSYSHNSHKSLKNLDRDLILRESIRLAITSHLWSKYSTRDFVKNLPFFVGGV